MTPLAYDPVHELALIEAIAVAMFEVSGVTDANVVMIRPGECARALVKSLAMVLALAPAATRSPASLKKMVDEIGKCLRQYVAEAERDNAAREFLRRTFRDGGPEGHA